MNQSINTDSKNSKEPQHKYRLGTVSIKILGGLNRFYRRLTSPSASIMAQNIQLFGPRGGFLSSRGLIRSEPQDSDTFKFWRTSLTSWQVIWTTLKEYSVGIMPGNRLLSSLMAAWEIKKAFSILAFWISSSAYSLFSFNVGIEFEDFPKLHLLSGFPK